jgi:hypothetical protein
MIWLEVNRHKAVDLLSRFHEYSFLITETLI